MGKTFSFVIDFSDAHDFKQGEYPVIYELQTTYSDLLGFKYSKYANRTFIESLIYQELYKQGTCFDAGLYLEMGMSKHAQRAYMLLFQELHNYMPDCIIINRHSKELKIDEYEKIRQFHKKYNGAIIKMPGQVGQGNRFVESSENIIQALQEFNPLNKPCVIEQPKACDYICHNPDKKGEFTSYMRSIVQYDPELDTVTEFKIFKDKQPKSKTIKGLDSHYHDEGKKVKVYLVPDRNKEYSEHKQEFEPDFKENFNSLFKPIKYGTEKFNKRPEVNARRHEMFLAIGRCLISWLKLRNEKKTCMPGYDHKEYKDNRKARPKVGISYAEYLNFFMSEYDMGKTLQGLQFYPCSIICDFSGFAQQKSTIKNHFIVFLDYSIGDYGLKSYLSQFRAPHRNRAEALLDYFISVKNDIEKKNLGEAIIEAEEVLYHQICMFGGVNKREEIPSVKLFRSKDKKKEKDYNLKIPDTPDQNVFYGKLYELYNGNQNFKIPISSIMFNLQKKCEEYITSEYYL